MTKLAEARQKKTVIKDFIESQHIVIAATFSVSPNEITADMLVPPKHYKKAETIAEWQAAKRAELMAGEEAIRFLGSPKVKMLGIKDGGSDNLAATAAAASLIDPTLAIAVLETFLSISGRTVVGFDARKVLNLLAAWQLKATGELAKAVVWSPPSIACVCLDTLMFPFKTDSDLACRDKYAKLVPATGDDAVSGELVNVCRLFKELDIENYTVSRVA